MFGMHEMPGSARRRVLRNAMRLAKKTVLAVDIWPGFEPSPMMLSGEPYVLDYLRKMDDDVVSCAPVRIAVDKGWRVTRERLLPKHVVVWHLERVN